MKTKTKKKPIKQKPDPVLACLIAARKRITPKGAWCRGACARNHFGNFTYTEDPAAVAWCVVGAIELDNGARGALYAAMDSDDSLSAWNDAPGRTQKEVLALFDKAIALRRKEATK